MVFQRIPLCVCCPVGQGGWEEGWVTWLHIRACHKVAGMSERWGVEAPLFFPSRVLTSHVLSSQWAWEMAVLQESEF